jgi:hypothetical protein
LEVVVNRVFRRTFGSKREKVTDPSFLFLLLLLLLLLFFRVYGLRPIILSNSELTLKNINLSGTC